MTETLYELLAPYIELEAKTSGSDTALQQTAVKYLDHVSSLSLSELTNKESSALEQSSQTLLRSLQSLSKKSHKALIDAAGHLTTIPFGIPSLYISTDSLRSALPDLEKSSTNFSQDYRRSAEDDNENLVNRARALLLARNTDRIASVLELTTLLSSTVASSHSSSGPTAVASTISFGSALDLQAHVRRLSSLYPDSRLVSHVSTESDREMRILRANIIENLKTRDLKLAVAIRLIGYLKRVAPELDDEVQRLRSPLAPIQSLNSPSAASQAGANDGILGALFLVCRLSNLTSLLHAFDPLKELADQEKQARVRRNTTALSGPSTSGQWQQTERYLKKYIEVFREQSFSILSMYRNIFPSPVLVPSVEVSAKAQRQSSPENLAELSTKDAFDRVPSPLTTFVPHLVELLFSTLKEYLPNITDKSARESLMTQTLYCAGSLGRLGGDFSMMLTLLDDNVDNGYDDDDKDDDEVEEGVEHAHDHELQSITPASDPILANKASAMPYGGFQLDWLEAMKRHRIQASRLELLASGVGVGKGKAANAPQSVTTSS